MEILIKDIDIVTMVGDEVLYSTNLYIKDDRIYHIGDIREDIKPDKIIDGRGKLLMPGLVNGHTHLGMSMLRNYADDLPLHRWLEEKIWPIEAKLVPEDIYWASMLSMIEMIKTGTTSFCDMYFFMDQVGRAAEEIGIRGVLTRGIVEDETRDEKLKETKDLYLDWNGRANGRIKVMVAPHAPYTCSPDFIKECIDLAKELNTGIHIHLSETSREVNESYEEYGKSPIKLMEELGLFEVPTIAAHCVHLNEEDIRILRDNKVYPVNNPGSNMKLASGFAPIDKMLKEKITVALGTDGSSSNNNLNMFEEINLAAVINKGFTGDAVSVPAYKALEMATINGAKALQWEDEIASIETGKKADMIIIDINKPHLIPHHNLISLLAYSVQGSDVETVIIDGKVIMEDRKILTVDEEEVMSTLIERTKDLINR